MLKTNKRRRKSYKRKKRSSSFPFLIVGAVIFFIFFFTLAILAERSGPLPTGISIHREEDFIEEMAEEAVKLQEEYGILPSVTIAQAILESNWGRSGLAQNENNYFGIKGSSDSVEYVTREYTEEWIEIDASFRSYSSWEESMEDYAQLMAHGTNWNSDLYRDVVEAENYEEAAYALKEAGYATDPDYPEKVISLVEDHDLHRFDDPSYVSIKE